MATVYRVDGTILHVKPAHGKKFTLDEVQEIVGGHVQSIPIGGAKIVLCDEDGQHKGLPFNGAFHEHCQPWGLVGDVLVVSRGEF